MRFHALVMIMPRDGGGSTPRPQVGRSGAETEGSARVPLKERRITAVMGIGPKRGDAPCFQGSACAAEALAWQQQADFFSFS